MCSLFANISMHSRLLVVLLAASVAQAEEIDRRVHGMLLGAAIGDAVGGPVEFVYDESLQDVLPRFRTKHDVVLEQADFSRLAERLPMLGYAQWRPRPEPYAHWLPNAPAGTITDDTRHKIVLIDALRTALDEPDGQLDCRAIAEAFVAFADRPEVRTRPGWSELCSEWDRECLLAARWVCGERDPAVALPPTRLWGGVGTCCGQMMLPPLAALYPGDPERAYLAAYELGFLDNGEAKDINAAIVAGLAFALTQPLPGDDPEQRRVAWRGVLDAMIQTDPLRYSEVEFMDRALERWTKQACRIADEADGSPAKVYELIGEACPRVHAWEAAFLLVEVVALADFAGGEPLAAMHLALDFGEDTDSAAQLLGALFGAMYGPDVFPVAMQRAVHERLEADHGESLIEWTRLLAAGRKRERAGTPVVRFGGSQH